MKSSLKQFIPYRVYNFIHNIYIKLYQQNVRRNPVRYANKIYYSIFGENLNLKNPTNLIEKIYWLQFNTDTSLWTICADKYRVRNFVEDRGLGNILCKLYGMWESPSNIDFDNLPNSFVLKANNSCGQVLLVRDKNKLNYNDIYTMLNDWLSRVYGYDGAQLHYTRIKRCIIAEELLPTPEGSSLVDYKIWCFDGKPECILVCYNRNGAANYNLSMYDTQWNNISSIALKETNKHFCGSDIKRPENLDEMLNVAVKLSAGFKEVRVDLYNIEGRIVFGELTFTTGYGSYKKEFYEYLGSKLILPTDNTNNL